jgi:hypothetical protein
VATALIEPTSRMEPNFADGTQLSGGDWRAGRRSSHGPPAERRNHRPVPLAPLACRDRERRAVRAAEGWAFPSMLAPGSCWCRRGSAAVNARQGMARRRLRQDTARHGVRVRFPDRPPHGTPCSGRPPDVVSGRPTVVRHARPRGGRVCLVHTSLILNSELRPSMLPLTREQSMAGRSEESVQAGSIAPIECTYCWTATTAAPLAHSVNPRDRTAIGTSQAVQCSPSRIRARAACTPSS